MQFRLLDNSIIEPMQGMRIEANFRIVESRRVKILELPYSNSDYNMYILIPKTNNIHSLNRLAESFNMSRIEKTLHVEYVELIMPSFKISFELDLKTC